MEEEGGKEESFGIRHIRKEAEYKARLYHSTHGIFPVNRTWRLQVVSSFGREVRGLHDDVEPRGLQGSRDGREESVTGTRTRTEEVGTRTGMGARTRARTGTRIERRVEGTGSLGTLEGVIEVSQKT